MCATTSSGSLMLLLLATSLAAQVSPNHAVVITELPQVPRSQLLQIDLQTGRTTRFGRFAQDDSPPLGVAIDPVDRDLIVALNRQGNTRLLRVPLQGPNPGVPRLIADVRGLVTDIEAGICGEITFTTGGAQGGLFGVPRNGGAVRQIIALPRAAGLFDSSFVLQAGSAGPPVVDPRIVAVDRGSGKIVSTTPMTGYRPLDVVDLVVLPNAVLNKLVCNADGTMGELVLNRSQTIKLTPRLPAGATRRVRTFGNSFLPYVLGGRADPRLKTLPAFSNGSPQTWTFVSGPLPGDPIDFDISRPAGPFVVNFGPRCVARNGLSFISWGLPQIGSATFAPQLTGGDANGSAVLGIGLSDDRLGAVPLPLRLGGGCQLLISADLLIPASTNGLGVARVTLPIPNNPGLAGSIVFGQWAQFRNNRLETSEGAALQIDR